MPEFHQSTDIDFQEAVSKAANADSNFKFSADHLNYHPEQIPAFRESIMKSYKYPGDIKNKYNNSKFSVNNIFSGINKELEKMGAEHRVDLIE